MDEPNSSPAAGLITLLDQEKIKEAPDSVLGRRLVELHTGLRHYHAIAQSANSLTVRHAVAMGQIFQEAFRRHAGEFEAWLRVAVGEDAEGRVLISVDTARRWRTLWEKRDRLFPVGEEAPECRTLTEAYIKVGLIPPPKAEEKSEAGPRSFRLTFSAPAVDPEQWPAADRRDFLERTEPIVQLRDRLKAIAEAA